LRTLERSARLPRHGERAAPSIMAAMTRPWWRGGGQRRPWPILALALVLLPAAPRAALAQPPGELRGGGSRAPRTLGPAAGGVSALVLRQVLQGLVEVGERGDLEPGLAASWTVSRDGLTWTFRLRPDVQFHNGTPLTADLVAAALARRLTADQPGGEPTT